MASRLNDRELGYNTRFVYPRLGIGALSSGLARAVPQIELGRALRKGQRLEAENHALRAERFPQLIAQSAAMRPVLDVISPCVQFNNHAGSTKSFDYVREHNAAINRLDVILDREEIAVDYAPGSVELVTQHAGTVLTLRKLADDYDPTDRVAAIMHLQTHQARGEIVTGLLFVDPEASDLHDHLQTVSTPLNQLGDAELTPGAAALAEINESLR